MGISTKQPISNNEAESWDHNGFKIYDWSHGFKASDNGLALIASYIVVKENLGVGFAFYINLIDLSLRGNNINSTILEGPAKSVIYGCLEYGNIKDKVEYTYEYNISTSEFIEVIDPAWWIKTSSEAI